MDQATLKDQLSYLYRSYISRYWNFLISLINKYYCELVAMKARPEKIRQYHIDSKQITAKKGKKNHDNFTPNSLSTSHNHHKYEKIEKVLETSQEKEPVTIKQFQAVVRSLLVYTKKKHSNLEEHSKKSKIAWKIYQYLHERYRIMGDRQQIEKVKALFQKHMQKPERSCTRCKQSGIKCKETHLKYLNEVLPEDIEALEQKLEDLQIENELCSKILEIKKKSNNKEVILQELKFIIKHQEKTIRELEQRESQPDQQRNYKRSKLEIFIDEDQT